MKITKLVHSCLLVEMPDRTALFDPGAYSAEMVDAGSLVYLDDIIVTHEHYDHMDVGIIKQLVEKFPGVRVTAPSSAARQLNDEGIATADGVDGIVRFDAPHESVEPMFETPEATGVHYLERLTHPGDSHSFSETMPILALPVTAPWGATSDAVKLALKRKPKYIIPIHDWHWRPEAREQMYAGMEKIFAENDIQFIKPKDGEAFNIKI